MKHTHKPHRFYFEALFFLLAFVACKTRQYNETSDPKTDLFQESSKIRTGLYAIVPFFHGVDGKPMEKVTKDKNNVTQERMSCLYGTDFYTKDLARESLLNDQNLLYFKANEMPAIVPKKAKHQLPIETQKLRDYFADLQYHSDESGSPFRMLAEPLGLIMGVLFAVTPAGPAAMAGLAVAAISGGSGAQHWTKMSRAEMKIKAVCNIAKTTGKTADSLVTTKPTRIRLAGPGLQEGLSTKSIVGGLFQDAVNSFHHSKAINPQNTAQDPSQWCPANLKLALLQTEIPCDGSDPLETNIDVRFRELMKDSDTP